jgi:hypothetical protein
VWGGLKKIASDWTVEIIDPRGINKNANVLTNLHGGQGADKVDELKNRRRALSWNVACSGVVKNSGEAAIWSGAKLQKIEKEVEICRNCSRRTILMQELHQRSVGNANSRVALVAGIVRSQFLLALNSSTLLVRINFLAFFGKYN